MNGDDAIPLLAIFGIFVAPVIAMVAMRILAHRERIELIRRGIVPPPNWGSKNDWRSMGNVPPNVPPNMPPGPPPPFGNDAAFDRDSPERHLRKGIMLALIGLAIFIGLSFIGYNDGTYRPGPWLLGGLVPMFVGIAQIIIALLSGARFGMPGQFGNPGMYPPPGPPPPGTPPSGPGPRIYEPEPRVHNGYEELKRPVPPPDRR
jgi:hypothetical protein